MTHGYSPFVGEKGKGHDMHSIFNNINNRNFTIKANISQECKNLISKMLTLDSTKRMKINEVFEDPWVKKFEDSLGKSFAKFNKLSVVFP